jgi:hypothetical protein
MNERVAERIAKDEHFLKWIEVMEELEGKVQRFGDLSTCWIYNLFSTSKFSVRHGLWHITFSGTIDEQLRDARLQRALE